MAFSGTLPQVVANIGPGGGIVGSMSAGNALTTQNLQNKQLEIANQYAPALSAADVNLKNQQAYWTPLQYQMQMLSNPLLWEAAKSNPGLQNSLAQMMQNPMKNMGNAPQPISPNNINSNGGGIGGMLKNIFLGPQSNINPMNPQNMPMGGNQNAMMGGIQQPSNAGMNATASQNASAEQNAGSGSSSNPSNTSSPLLPASTDQPVSGTLTAPYNTSPVKAGDLFWDAKSGKMISAADPAVVQQAQQGLSGLQRIDPLIRRLAIEQAPLQSGWTRLLSDVESAQNQYGPKGLSSMLPQIEQQYPDIAKQFNLTGLGLPTLKARADSDLATAPEQLIRIYGLRPGKNTTQELSKIIEPAEGETGDQYTQRLMEKIGQMQQEEGAPYKQQLGQGFDLTVKQDPQTKGLISFETPQEVAQRTGQAIPDNNAQAQSENMPTKTFTGGNTKQPTGTVQAIKRSSNGGLYHKIDGNWYPVTGQ
jgi:hypothetical protein